MAGLYQSYGRRQPSPIRLGARIVLAFMFVLAAATSCSREPGAVRDAAYQKGMSYVGQKNFGAAVVEFKNALQVDPRFVNGHEQLGLAYVEMNKMDNAAASLGKAIELDPARGHLRAKRARALAGLGKLDEAETAVEARLKEKSDDVEALVMSGGLSLARKDVSAARKTFAQAAATASSWRATLPSTKACGSTSPKSASTSAKATSAMRGKRRSRPCWRCCASPTPGRR